MPDVHTDLVTQWGIFELTLSARAEGNPFTDITVHATFTGPGGQATVTGFYDGEGFFRLRFMPPIQGQWQYVTSSNHPALDGYTGAFTCTAPEAGNHGPVGVVDMYHFAYADGAPYHQIGTTAYGWQHFPAELQAQTLSTLRTSAFNKLRMLIFPKFYELSPEDPQRYPYERTTDGAWDFTRFNLDFFQHLDRCISQLMALGIEADVILFHPYDRWGFAELNTEQSDLYLRYVVARLAAFRNVWWSLANEYDLMKSKSLDDWDRIFAYLQEHDPAQHLRSIHNCGPWYDHGKPWVTHASIQHTETGRARELREKYGKPVIYDEVCYEGDISHGWGNLTPQKLTQFFWEGTVAGGYVGHSETYWHPENLLWWSRGGILRGESPARIAFLRDILDESPAGGFTPVQWSWDLHGAGKGEAYYLFYFGDRQPREKYITIPTPHRYRIDIIDTWEMTITPMAGEFSGKVTLPLPAKPYMAARLMRCDG